MADLFKLAGRDVRVAEADNVLNAQANSVFNSVTAGNIANSTLLAADENGKIIPSTTAYVTVVTAQEISGQKTFTAPALANGEQPTTTFLTANGGRIIFGKEGQNSGSMIALEQEKGTRRLNFRSSSTPGAMVWEQPESGSALFYDVENVNFRGTNNVNGNGNFTWTLSGTNKFTVPYPGTVTPIISLGLQKISAAANEYSFYKFNSTTNGVVLDLFTAPSIGVLKDGTYKNSLNIGDAVSGVVLTSGNKGVSNGVASLDNNGKIPTAQIPNNYLDKGDSASAAAQTVYNPVELKKPLVAPAVKGESFTVSDSAQNTFTLGGSITQESGKTLRQSQLILSGGTDSTLYKSGIVQDSNGHFFIIPKDSSNTANALWWVESNGGWRIGDNRIVTYDMLSNSVTTLQSHIKGQADDWIWLGKVAENVYTMDLSEIKPGASGTTTGATCYVSINTFHKRMSSKQLFKTVIDATCRCEPFELKHLDVKVLLSNVGSKWFMPRMFVSRGAMASDAFTHMMAVLYEDRAYVGLTVDECSVFRDMTTALGTLNANGIVSPIYGMKADGFV